MGEGEVLAREGRIGREFFLILSGRVAVTQKGRRVNALGPGDFFGELAAMNPGPRNATVTALSDLDVLIIGSREFAAMGKSRVSGTRSSGAWPAASAPWTRAWRRSSTELEAPAHISSPDR